MYSSTKTFTHSLGLSAAFRQWRAKSHCRFIHGYPLEFKIIFSSYERDENGWVVDFGALKPIKEHLIDVFDHKLLVAGDDPEMDIFIELSNRGLAEVVVMPDGVGCENFAKHVFDYAENFLEEYGYAPRVWLESVEVREHGGNSAIYYGEDE